MENLDYKKLYEDAKKELELTKKAIEELKFYFAKIEVERNIDFEYSFTKHWCNKIFKEFLQKKNYITFLENTCSGEKASELIAMYGWNNVISIINLNYEKYKNQEQEEEELENEQ